MTNLFYISLVILSVQAGDQKAFAFTITGGPFVKNKFGDSEVMLMKSSVGPKMCVKNCLMVTTCVAVNYISAEFRCELLKTVSSTILLQNKVGYDYTEMDSWQMSKNPCFPNPCSGKSKCIEKNLKEYISVKLATCRIGWLQLNGKCYFFSDITRNWLSAKIYCESKNYILAEPRTKEEINCLTSVASIKRQKYWIGGTDNQTESKWIWAYSKTPITITYWSYGEPNDSGKQEYSENCLVMSSKWNDIPCGLKMRFVCENWLW